MATAAKDAGSPAPKTRTPKATAKAAVQTIAPTSITTVPFGRLKRAPQNVRKTDIAADVVSLAEDIAAHGLLQSLIGYAGDTAIDAKAVYIVGGGRRLQALELLRTQGTIKDSWPVPVLIRPETEAVELSLSENLARRDMNPADEFVAFAALMAPGNRSPANLAKQFGFTERYIKQRLRLAALHPEILAALRDGKLSMMFAIEYAKAADQEVQLQVYRAIQRGTAFNKENMFHLRAMLSQEQLREDSTVFQFIDRETYEREGGGYVEDLFEDSEHGRRLDNTVLARTIADRCLRFQAEGRVLAKAKAEHPSVVGCVVEPLGLGLVKAPAGFVEIASGWNSTLNRHVDVDGCWKRADAQGAPIQIVVGLTREEPIGEDDDGSPLAVVAEYRRERFFVQKDCAKQVLPPKETTYGGNYTPLTEEQRRAQEIEREARVWAARLTVPKFSDLPGFEGRVFYGRDWLDTHERKPGDPMAAGYTPCFELKVFVTEEEIAANMEAGRAKATELREVLEIARAAKVAEKEAAAEAQAKALSDMIAEIGALEIPPAVIMASQYLDDDPTPWFRWSAGDYWDMRQDDPDADNAMGVESVDEMADTMAVIAGHYPTIEAFDAAQQVARSDAEATEA